MNKRRKAQVFSLMLAVLMLASVVPAFVPGFLKPVSAAGYITSVTATTNYGDSTLFNGFPYYINITITATQSTFANITLVYHYQNGTNKTVYSTIRPIATGTNTILINSSSDIPSAYANIPQNVNKVTSVVYESEWNASTSSYVNVPGSETVYNFTVESPFTVTFTSITSAVPYYNGSAWLNNKAFEYISFNATVNITYNPILANSSLITVPSAQNVSIILPNGTVKVVTVDITGKTANITQNNTGAVVVHFAGVNKSGNIGVKSTGGSYTFVNTSASCVCPWYLDTAISYYYKSTSATKIFKLVPFNATISVTAESDFGTVGVNTTAYANLTGVVSGSNTSATMTNGVATITLINVKVDPATVLVYLTDYPAINKTLTLNATPWKIDVTNYNVSYNGQVSTYNGQPVFWVNLPNPVFNVSINYPIAPYLVNSTASIAMYNLNSQLLSGTITVTNDNGASSFSVGTPTSVGNVTVKIWDSYYNVTDPLAVPVLDWNVSSTYYVYEYNSPSYTAKAFYVGIPASLNVTAHYNLSVLLNSSVVVEVYNSTGGLLVNTTIPITNNNGSAIVLNNVTFTKPGYLTVKVYNTTLGVYTSYTIPIKDWGIYLSTYPTQLVQNKTTNFNVEVRGSIYFNGPTRPVNVTLTLPDGTVYSKILNLTPSLANGGYYGTLSFVNITSSKAGIAKVTVYDSAANKTVTYLVPVYPTTGKIYVETSPSEFYQYVPGELYIKIMNYTGPTPAELNVVVYYPNASVAYNGTVYYNGGTPVVEVPITSDTTGNLMVEVSDSTGNYVGIAEVPVESWNVTFSYATNGTVYKYLNNELYVTVHVPINVPVNVTVGNETFTNVVNGQKLTVPIASPSAPVTFKVNATYNGHLVGSDTYTITPKEWSVSVSMSPTEAYEYVPTMVSITATPSISEVSASELEIYVNGNEYTGPFQAPSQTTNYTITVYYDGHLMANVTKTFTVEPWNVTFTESPAYLWENVPTKVYVDASSPVVTNVTITYDNMTYTGVGGAEFEVANPTEPVSFSVVATYNGHVINKATYTLPVKPWGIYVNTYPSSLYANLAQNVSILIGYSAGITSTAKVQVFLPDGSNFTKYVTVHEVSPNSAIAVVSLGTIKTTAGYVRIVVTDEASGKSATVSIPVQKWTVAAMVKPQYIYANISSDVTVNIIYKNGSLLNSEANVTLCLPDGSMMSEVVPVHNGMATVTFQNVVSKAPGKACVKVVDLKTNESAMATFEVRNWFIKFSVAPSNAYLYMPVNYSATVTFVDNVTKEPMMINTTAKIYWTGALSGNTTVEITNGQFSGCIACNAIPTSVGAVNFTAESLYGKEAMANAMVYNWSIEVKAPEAFYVYSGYYNHIYANFTFMATNGEVVPYTGTAYVKLVVPGNLTYKGTFSATVNVTNTTTGAGYANATITIDGVSTNAMVMLSNYTGSTPVSVKLPGGASFPGTLTIKVNGSMLCAKVILTNNMTVFKQTFTIINNSVSGAIEAVFPGVLRTTVSIVNGTGSVDFGMAEITGLGTAYLGVAAVINGHVKITEISIPVMNLITITNVTPASVYAKVPTNVYVKVLSGPADYSNITVSIEGQNITATYIGNQTYEFENLALPAGNYTIVAKDSIYDATATVKLESVGWHLMVIPFDLNTNMPITSISLGSYNTIGVAVVAVLDSNSSRIVPISDVAKVTVVFSNETIYPLETSKTVYMVNGVGVTNVSIYAPAYGYFNISAVDEYGKTASAILQVSKPKTITWVYVNIRKEGSLQSPNTTTMIYYSFNNRTGPYIPAYDFVHNYWVNGTTEAIFPVAPTKAFNLYVIAVPISVAEAHSVLYLHSYTWSLTNSSVTYNYSVKVLSKTSWQVSVEAYKYTTIKTYVYSPPTAPGMIPIAPQSSSVQGNAIYTSVAEKTSQITNAPYEKNFTVSVKPDAMKIMLLSNMTLKPAQAGSYFEFMVKVCLKNATGQVNEQFNAIRSYIENITYINNATKEEMISTIYNDLMSYANATVGPVAGANVTFHMSNNTISYLEPTSGVTNANGTVTFKLYSKATANMTPEQLKELMGSVTVWATYDGLVTSNITVNFGGIGQISGDVVDPNNHLLPGALVELYVWNGSAWVPAKDYAGNVIMTHADARGHYSMDVPAAVNGTKYRVVAEYAGAKGYADVVVKPFLTSTADVVVSTYSIYTGLAELPYDVQTHTSVSIVIGSKALESGGVIPDYMASMYLTSIIGVVPSTYDNQITPSSLSSKDMLILMGGPAVNSLTAYYQKFAPVKMNVGANGTVTIVTPNSTITWKAPTPWWNVSKGYWVIQRVVDPNTGAVVYMIYGTDMQSTWAAAYYFTHNLQNLNGVSWVVGCWANTQNVPYQSFLEHGSYYGFSPGDKITVISKG